METDLYSFLDPNGAVVSVCVAERRFILIEFNVPVYPFYPPAYDTDS